MSSSSKELLVNTATSFSTNKFTPGQGDVDFFLVGKLTGIPTLAINATLEHSPDGVTYFTTGATVALTGNDTKISAATGAVLGHLRVTYNSGDLGPAQAFFEVAFRSSKK
jgi:hypothetical protein